MDSRQECRVPVAGKLCHDEDMELYVVLDTKGSGRLVGVFDDPEVAHALAAQYPSYYKLHCCRLNQIEDAVLGWIDDPIARAAIARLIGEQRA